MPLVQRFNPISRHQFGYRPNTSTLMATCLLKETVQNYLDENSNVYACFLDLSKAFERVNHDLLLDKMKINGTPDKILKILNFIFSHSLVGVDFEGSLSQKWLIKRGVRQGGILSAHLFCIYIDEILLKVSKLPYACRLGISKLNIQAYADEIVVLCPSATGLKVILSVLQGLMDSHFLCINCSKLKFLSSINKRNHK